MNCGSTCGFTSSIGDVEDDQNRSVSELIASLRSASVVTFEEVRKLSEAIQTRFEHLRSENKSFRDEFVRLNLENIHLQHELQKCRASSDECVVEKVGRGGGETSFKETMDELRRKNDQLEGEKRELESRLRDSAKKYQELDQRVLQLERDTSMLKNEEQCTLGNREGKSKVLREPDILINVDAFGHRGSARRGNDSKGDGSVSLMHNATKKLDYVTGACLSPFASSSCKSQVKDGVLQGDGSPPIVEIIESDDDSSGPSKKLSGDKYHGGRNDAKGNKELKRKRGSVSSDFDEPYTQTVRGMSAALKHEQKNIKEDDSDNSLSKSSAVNSIKHENGAGSASPKSNYESSLHRECWK